MANENNNQFDSRFRNENSALDGSGSDRNTSALKPLVPFQFSPNIPYDEKYELEKEAQMSLEPEWLTKRNQENSTPPGPRASNSANLERIDYSKRTWKPPKFRYSKEDLLRFHKATEFSDELNSISIPGLLSRESLPPVAFVPIEVQEEQAARFNNMNRNRFVSRGAPGTLGQNQGPMGRGRGRGRGRDLNDKLGERSERMSDRPIGEKQDRFERFGERSDRDRGVDRDRERSVGDRSDRVERYRHPWSSDRPRESLSFKDRPPLRHPSRTTAEPWGSSDDRKRSQFDRFDDQDIAKKEQHQTQMLEEPKIRRPARELMWLYKDPQNIVQGPFSDMEMNEWYEAGYFSATLLVKRAYQSQFVDLGVLPTDENGSPFFTLESEILPPGEEPVVEVKSETMEEKITDSAKHAEKVTKQDRPLEKSISPDVDKQLKVETQTQHEKKSVAKEVVPKKENEARETKEYGAPSSQKAVEQPVKQTTQKPSQQSSQNREQSPSKQGSASSPTVEKRNATKVASTEPSKKQQKQKQKQQQQQQSQQQSASPASMQNAQPVDNQEQKLLNDRFGFTVPESTSQKINQSETSIAQPLPSTTAISTQQQMSLPTMQQGNVAWPNAWQQRAPIPYQPPPQMVLSHQMQQLPQLSQQMGVQGTPFGHPMAQPFPSQMTMDIPSESAVEPLKRKEGVFLLDESGLPRTMHVVAASSFPVMVSSGSSSSTNSNVPPNSQGTAWRTEGPARAMSLREIQEQEIQLKSQAQQMTSSSISASNNAVLPVSNVSVENNPSKPAEELFQVIWGSNVVRPAFPNQVEQSQLQSRQESIPLAAQQQPAVSYHQEEEEYFWEPVTAPSDKAKESNSSATSTPASWANTSVPPQSLRFIQEQQQQQQQHHQQHLVQQQQQQNLRKSKDQPSWNQVPKTQLSLKEIQEQEMQRAEQARLEQQRQQEMMAAMKRSKEERERLVAPGTGWVNPVDSEKQQLSLREIQELELREQQRRIKENEQRLLEQRKQQQSQGIPANTTRWTGGWSAPTQSDKKLSLKEIQEMELKQKTSAEHNSSDKYDTYPPSNWPKVIEAQQQPQQLSDNSQEVSQQQVARQQKKSKHAEPSPTKNPPKQKKNNQQQQSQPAKNLGTVWGSQSSAPKSLKEIQEEELQRAISQQPAKPQQQNTTTTPASNNSTSSNDDSFFWEVPEDTVTKKGNSTTGTNRSNDSDFPALGSNSSGANSKKTKVEPTLSWAKKQTKPLAKSDDQVQSSKPQQSQQLSNSQALQQQQQQKKKKGQKLPASLLGFTVFNPNQGEIETLDE